MAKRLVAVNKGVECCGLVSLRNGAMGVEERVLGLDLLGDEVSKLERRGVEGREEGGDGNRDSPRLMVLSAIPEALVSRDGAVICLEPFGRWFCCDIPLEEATTIARLSCMFSTNVKGKLAGPHALCNRTARINRQTREKRNGMAKGK